MQGWALTTSYGRVIDAQAVGLSPNQLTQGGAPPAPGACPTAAVRPYAAFGLASNSPASEFDPPRLRNTPRFTIVPPRAWKHAELVCDWVFSTKEVLVMSSTWLYPLILIAGALQAWGPPMNGALRNALTNPWLASLVSFLPIVAFLVVVLACVPRPLPTIEGVSAMPWWARLAD